MLKEDLGYFDYLKAAFHLKVNLPGLGHLPVNKLLLVGFAILGFGNAGFWFLGLAFEIGYLLFLSGNERFQKVILGNQLEQDNEHWAEREAQLLSFLDRLLQERYQRLSQSCQNIVKTSENNSSSLNIAEFRSGDLNQLLWIFLKLLNSQQRINSIVSQTTKKNLEDEIQETAAKLTAETETSPVYRSLKSTREIQQRRLDNFIKAEESLKVTEAELNRIEKQVTLITEETTINNDPSILSVRLDGVMQSLQGTTKWMSEHDELFGIAGKDSNPVNLIKVPVPKGQKE